MKYKLTGETLTHEGKTLHRIEALVDIPLHGIKAGDRGGYIEKEDNLSQEGDARVGDNVIMLG